MRVRRKCRRIRPPSNRWPDFVRFVAWPIGEEAETACWIGLLNDAHYLMFFMGFALFVAQLASGSISGVVLLLVAILSTPIICFTLTDLG
jgi:hypothetical protein